MVSEPDAAVVLVEVEYQKKVERLAELRAWLARAGQEMKGREVEEQHRAVYAEYQSQADRLQQRIEDLEAAQRVNDPYGDIWLDRTQAERREALAVLRQCAVGQEGHASDLLPTFGETNGDARIWSEYETIISRHLQALRLLNADADPTPAIRDLWRRWYAALRGQYYRLEAVTGTDPEALTPFKTFKQLRNMVAAVREGIIPGCWTVTGDSEAIHDVSGKDGLTTLFSLVGEDKITKGRVEEELAKLGSEAALLLRYCASRVCLEKRDITLSLDELITRANLMPRDASEGRKWELRREVWGWLMFFGRLEFRGPKGEPYRDPRTKEVTDVEKRWTLLLIAGGDYPTSGERAGCGIPLRVTIAPGAWLRPHLVSDVQGQITQSFGYVEDIQAISPGRPAGRWARSLSDALYQLWRERAAKADKEFPVGRWAVSMDDLLGLAGLKHEVDTILKTRKSGRGPDYLRKALEDMKRAGIIGSYTLDDPPPNSYKWQRSWQRQLLTIKPIDEVRYDYEKAKGAAARGRKVRQRSSND